MGALHIFQENDYYCGPAVAQMVLKLFNIEVTQTILAKELETDMQLGTSATELQNFFEKQGFLVERKNNAEWRDIASALEKGEVVVGYIEPDGDPHYALVREVGKQVISLRDPWYGENHTLTKEDFLLRWKDDETNQYGERMLLAMQSPQRI